MEVVISDETSSLPRQTKSVVKKAGPYKYEPAFEVILERMNSKNPAGIIRYKKDTIQVLYFFQRAESYNMLQRYSALYNPLWQLIHTEAGIDYNRLCP